MDKVTPPPPPAKPRVIAAGVRRPAKDPRPSVLVLQCGTAVVRFTAPVSIAA